MSVLLFAGLGAALAGFLALSLAMERHHEQAFGTLAVPRARRLGLRALGTAELLASLQACIALQGPTRGWVLWAGVLTAAALAVILVHTWAARRAPALACGAVALQVAGLLGLAEPGRWLW